MPADLGQLEAPPIVEVVCGFLFDDASRVDLLLITDYSLEERERFPTRDVQAAILEPTNESFREPEPAQSVRLWLVSPAQDVVVQLQHDRMYVNWRARDERYPRFKSRDGQQGLLDVALQAFDGFNSFVEARRGYALKVRSVHLTKIDHFVENQHWFGWADLQAMLPMTRSLDFAQGERLQFRLQAAEERPGGRLNLVLASLVDRRPDGKAQKVIRLETSRSLEIIDQTAVRSGLLQLNEEVNEAFAALVPREQRRLRFGERE